MMWNREAAHTPWMTLSSPVPVTAMFSASSKETTLPSALSDEAALGIPFFPHVSLLYILPSCPHLSPQSWLRSSCLGQGQ